MTTQNNTTQLTQTTNTARKRSHISVMWTEAQHAAYKSVDYGKNIGGSRRFLEDLLNGTVAMIEVKSGDESRRIKTFTANPETHAAVKELAAQRSMSVNSLVRNVLFGEEPKPLNKGKGLSIRLDASTADRLATLAAQSGMGSKDYAKQLLANALAQAA